MSWILLVFQFLGYVFGFWFVWKLLDTAYHRWIVARRPFKDMQEVREILPDWLIKEARRWSTWDRGGRQAESLLRPLADDRKTTP